MIGVRELRTELARHVRRAAAGERVVIAIGGRPAAALVPLTELPSGIEPLLASGALVPPRRTDDSRLRPPIPVWSGARLDRLLRELRG
jgi:prevent-host-death family protein